MDENPDPPRPVLPPTLPYARPPTSNDLMQVIVCFIFAIVLGMFGIFMLIFGVQALPDLFARSDQTELVGDLLAILFAFLMEAACIYICVLCTRTGYRTWRG